MTQADMNERLRQEEERLEKAKEFVRKQMEEEEKQDAMKQASEQSPYNCLTSSVKADAEPKRGILACGIAYNYVREALGDEARLLKVSQYPLPEEKIKTLAAECDELMVIEDGQPVVEELVKALLGAGYPVKGRLTGDLPRTGELTRRKGIGQADRCRLRSSQEHGTASATALSGLWTQGCLYRTEPGSCRLSRPSCVWRHRLLYARSIASLPEPLVVCGHGS